MENLKTVEEYSQEMTRREFDRFTEDNELCPRHFGLNDTFVDDKCSITMCKECYDKALVGIKFKESLLVLPEENMPVIEQIQNLEIKAKEIKEKEEELKAILLKAMEDNNIKKWENDVLTISYIAPTIRNSIDSTKLKKDMPEVAEKYTKTSNVKSSIRIKLKESK
ncbi:hypothetical protein KQI77_02295 [Clostridium sp. MSJ-8]|uniref:hypothetical protein n=1 Tax=Clostridium sp. MSJ-8 TaxID=2841510 RepID=UPI001C0F2827|nr:hypothetical protein [Clostridium sp. MSJ-8]MBU5486994.1 hypothetical protein [Clostridium sp. MSJ-8]